MFLYVIGCFCIILFVQEYQIGQFCVQKVKKNETWKHKSNYLMSLLYLCLLLFRYVFFRLSQINKRLLIFFLFLCTKNKKNEKLFCFFNVKNKEKQQFFISILCLTLIHYEEFLFYAFSYVPLCLFISKFYSRMSTNEQFVWFD